MDSQRTIAIVDDSEEDRTLYRRFLERDRRYIYRIVEFETAAEAIDSCKCFTVDLLLVDFMLPDATGLEFLEELKLVTGRKYLPAIVLTGQGDESVAVQAMKSGAQDYLVKGKLTDETLHRVSHAVMERVRLMEQVEQQQEQQRLMAAIALRIRLSLSLEIVLNTAVDEIRNFLKADRVIVYQFHQDKSGTVVAESVLPGWKSCLNLRFEDTCFKNTRGSYYRGNAGAVNDTHQAALSNCYVELLDLYQVQANLYVPIFSGTQPIEGDRCLLTSNPPVWGLLVAHQCSGSRQWQQWEMDLLEQLSVQLAIAIQQAELYQNLQILNAQLEVKVQERTAELQQSERKFRAIFEQTFQFIGLLTPDGTTLELNQASLEFFGAERDEVTGQRFWELSCCKALPKLCKGLQRAIIQASLGDFMRFEVTLPNAQGVQRTVDFSIKPIFNELGQVVLLLPEGRDITERKQAEEALCELNHDLELRVQQRTQDLEQANAKLRSEITERQRIEDELRRSEEKFRQLAEHIREVFFIFNRDFSEVIYISPAYEEIWGNSCSSMYHNSLSWLNLVHPEDKDRVILALQKQRYTEGFKQEYRIIRADGDIRWIRTQSFLVRDAAGAVQRIVGIAEDITEGKRTEAELQRRQQEFLALVENAPDVIARIERDYRYLYINPAVEAASGLPRQAFIGKTTAELGFPEETVTRIEQGVKQVFETGQEHFIEFRLEGLNGLKYYQSRMVPERTPRGNVTSVLFMSRDITLLKQTEIDMRETNALLQAIIQSAPVGIDFVDTDSKVVLWNPMNERLFGWEAKEVLGKPLPIIPYEEHEKFVGCTTQPFANCELTQIETRRQRKDGSLVDISLSTAMVRDIHGNIIGAIGICQDISERQAALRERKQVVDQLEHSLEEKETLLKEIHHRVKNNLQIISSLLRMQSRRAREESTMMLFQESQNRVQSMALIHEHLYQSPEISQIDFGEYIRSLTDNLFRCYGISQKIIVLTIETNGIKLNLDTAIPCGLLINELVSNSLKYAFPKGRRGEIVIRLMSATDNTITLTVSDSGIGIPESLDWSNTHSLGLRIVHNLTRQIKGNITLERENGTAFHITFSKVLKP
ncbi:hypothetical protein NUACC21_54290 [Scytonema sp. NUACC21]